MIERYMDSEMEDIWRERAKFKRWLQTECAVLEGRAACGPLDPAVAKRIRKQARFSTRRMAQLEAQNKHDLLAFIETVRASLAPADRGELHLYMTSYDTEEIPTILRLLASIAVLLNRLKLLRSAIFDRARQYAKTIMIGRTHGQHAEPITFGFKLLGWYDMLGRNIAALEWLADFISVGKIRGAVGVGGELSAEIEAHVCHSFGLRVAPHVTQIIHRDYHVRVLSELAVLGGNIEHIAKDLWIMSLPEIGEVREPFEDAQKGSSRMPHKKNPITLEQLFGLPRLLRGYDGSYQECIATFAERDISQSSVERIVLPDSFHLANRLVKRLTRVIAKMEVFPQRMLQNLDLTKGCTYSGPIKDLLLSWGMDPEQTYQLMQKLCNGAMSGTAHLCGLVSCNGEIEKLVKAGNAAERSKQLDECFNPWRGLKDLPVIFSRFGIDFETGEEIKKEEEVAKQP